MSLSILHGNFKLQDVEQGKVHVQPAILFVPKEENTKELDKVEITLWVSPNGTGGDVKNNVTKIVWQNSSWGTLRSSSTGGSS
eukprot:2680443-Ditylum_brightwellii.AAC.1